MRARARVSFAKSPQGSCGGPRRCRLDTLLQRSTYTYVASITPRSAAPQLSFLHNDIAVRRQYTRRKRFPWPPRNTGGQRDQLRVDGRRGKRGAVVSSRARKKRGPTKRKQKKKLDLAVKKANELFHDRTVSRQNNDRNRFYYLRIFLAVSFSHFSVLRQKARFQ